MRRIGRHPRARIVKPQGQRERRVGNVDPVAGARLDGGCAYRIAGRDPDTRWWSITAYGADDYLIANPANRYSISKNSVMRDADGGFDAEVSAASRASNWIPVARAPFSLTLRLYNPAPRVAADPVHAVLPKIEKVSCG